ncbi:MAG: helix-turn-helix transcriptional regulator [Planctomycetes bacterium]|nr:helix-turn-helix transcriptional regulator [Planctomycetota bacterium]
MNTAVDRNTERAEAIQKRVAELAETHSQAELSRKTEFSRNNVSRYVNGTRMPLEFGAALVEGLGINPSWLLTGEGTPYLSDINAGTQKMAGDLLALVDAMAAVNRMRLGSLTGKHHLGVLRELNETLKNYEELRGKLNAHSRKIFLKLIEDVRDALKRRDLNRAETLMQALDQVSRLTDDPFLRAQYEGAQSQFHHYNNDPEAALPHQRAVFASFLVHHSRFDDWMKPEAHNYVAVLEHNYRFVEARRVARAAVEMCDGEDPPMQHRAAVLDIELGDLQRGLNDLRRLIPLVDERYGYNLQQSLARGQVLEGSMTMPQAITFGGDLPAKWGRLAGTAVALEREPDIELILKKGVGSTPERVNTEDALAVHLSCLLEVLRDGGATPAQRLLVHIENTKQKQDDVTRFREQCMVAQLFRLGNQRKQALKHLRLAVEILASLKVGITPPVEYRILHARNVLALIGPDEKDAELKAWREMATAFAKDFHGRGYHSLRGLV